MALLDLLKEKKNETKVGIHPFVSEDDTFKYLYCFGLGVLVAGSERVYKDAKPIYEAIFEAMQMHENYKLRILEEVERDFDLHIEDVFTAMDTKEKQYCFLGDLLRISAMTSWGRGYCDEVIHIYSEAFGITKEELIFLREFWNYSIKKQSEEAVACYNQFRKNGYYISFKLLSYMYPSIILKEKYKDLILEAGDTVIMDKPTSIYGTVYVKNGGSLMIHGAAISLYGTIVVDGGRLDIRNSRIQLKEKERQKAAIQIESCGVIFIEHSRILGNHTCGLLCQKEGHLIIRDSKLMYSDKMAAVEFMGKSFTMKRVIFEDCKKGGIRNSESSRLTVNACQFISCIADHGGAIHSDTTEDVQILNSSFSKCRAEFIAPAIYFSYKKYGQVVKDCTFLQCEPQENLVYNDYTY